VSLRPELVRPDDQPVQSIMRPLGEYDWRDWQRLRPLTHWVKTLRYNAEREIYVRRPARGGDATLPDRIRGRRVLITIAFNDPDAIEMQAQAVAQFMPQALHVIADNSADDIAAMEIAAIAARRDIPCIRLPEHSWTLSQLASRSHGLALNWSWRNIVRQGEPEAFGFLDDDLFPTAADDPFAMLDRQPVYGSLRQIGSRWFLWAGYCVFRFDAVKDLPLDFGQDWFNGLDTGGGNWDVLYRGLDRERLQFSPTHFEPYRPGADPVHDSIQWCGAWLHEVGQTRRAGRLQQAADKRRTIKDLLAARQAMSGAGMTATRCQERVRP
jgi:hypothetical protein